MLTDAQIAAARSQLQQVLTSDKFTRAERLSRFLAFVAEETLAGRGDRLNQYAIGIEVFDRDESFDPSVDPAVRVEAGRLRSKLRDYYDEEGSDDPVRIGLAKRGYAVAFQFPPDLPAETAPGDGGRTSTATIAVLPFENLGHDPDQEYFADGISEDLITDLSKLPGLSVIARQSSFSYKGSATRLDRICAELGADYVLEGSIRRAGSRVRINAQLVEGDNGRQVWAQRFDRELGDIFELQDDVNEKIVNALQVHLSAEQRGRIARRGTDIVDAYDYVLRGMELGRDYTQEGSIRARYCFEQALALDPGYSIAYSRLALNYVYWWIAGWSEESKDSVDVGLEFAKRAVALDGEIALCQAVLCWSYLWSGDFEQAMIAGQRAIELDPNDVNALEYLALCMVWSGKPELANEYIERAGRLNPHEPYYFSRGVMQFMRGNYAAAIDLFRSRVEITPGFMPGFMYLAACYGLSENIELGKRVADDLLKLRPGFRSKSDLRTPLKADRDRQRLREGLAKVGLR